MLLNYVHPAGARFCTLASSIGMSERDALAMRDRPVADERESFILRTVHEACERLALTPPAGSC